MPAKKKPNIVLVTFDDCRPDHLGFMGYSKNTSPFLDSLAGKSAYFTRAFATGSGSPQSFVATLTSTYPLDYGGFSRIERPRVLVSEVLKKAGYKTIAVHSAAYLSSYFGYDKGWDVFRYLSHFEGGGVMPGIKQETARARMLKKISAFEKRLKSKLPFFGAVFRFFETLVLLARKIVKDATGFRPPFALAEEVNEEVKRILPENEGAPIFLWVHYMDVHEPLAFFWHKGRGLVKKIKFHIADVLLFLFSDHPRINRIFRRFYVELYDASISYVDGRIKELFGHLSSAGVITDRSVVIVASDHGEEFFEKGDFGHAQRPFNVNINIPLIIHAPGLIEARSVGRPVSLIDIPPTIADYAGAKKPSVWKGKSIFLDDSREVVAQFVDCEGDLTNLEFLGAAIIKDGYKFINFRGRKMLFSLGDMKEQEDLFARKPEVAAKMEAKLKNYIPAAGAI